jgi:UDP-N-acetylmuramate dehydrogenase
VLRGDVDLQALNTLRLPSRAECFANPESEEAAREAVAEARSKGLEVTILGGGSNVVLRTRVPGCVIVPRFRHIRIERSEDGCKVIAGAGVVWHELVRFCLGQGLYGLENLALIPGCVGAAPIQNIGAYGVELAERFDSLTAISCRDGSSVVMNVQQCGFGYRDSVFKRLPPGSFLIASVTLRVSRDFAARTDYPDILHELAVMGTRHSGVAVAEAVVRVRRRKLPDVRRVPNAGSFFKNPVLDADQVNSLRDQLGNLPSYPDANGIKVAAARLIDAAGWKGRHIGRAAVWQRQPLVLINRGGARAADILGLAHAIQEDVATRFGVVLELEPAVIGFDE